MKAKIIENDGTVWYGIILGETPVMYYRIQIENTWKQQDVVRVLKRKVEILE
jgi:hypothetical protein